MARPHLAAPLVLLLALLSSAGLAAQSVDLHTARIAPRGEVVIVYSKDFATCAHILTPSNQLVHTNNLWCTQGNNIASVHPSSAFNAFFGQGNQVKMCHGNNYNICSGLRTITAGPTLSANNYSVAVQSGGTQSFTLDAGTALSGQTYLLLGTASGTAGFMYGSHLIPLTPDGWFFFTLSSPNTFPFAGSAGTLNAAGMANASLTIPPGLSSTLIGLVFHHAFVVLSSSNLLGVSNPWPLTLT
jgi:hypothetical protein